MDLQHDTADQMEALRTVYGKPQDNYFWSMQGDVLVAEGLEQATRGPDNQPRLLASFIHRVVPVLGTVSHLRCARGNKAAWLAAWRDRGIYLLKTHVGMAVQVHSVLSHFFWRTQMQYKPC